MAEQCVVIVDAQTSDSHPHPCSIKATIESNGKWYCRMHDPFAVQGKEIGRLQNDIALRDHKIAKLNHLIGKYEAESIELRRDAEFKRQWLSFIYTVAGPVFTCEQLRAEAQLMVAKLPLETK